MVSAFSFLGLTSSPKRLAAGSSSRSNPSCLGANSLNRKLTPVALPPGRDARDETEIDRVFGDAENDGKACGRSLCCECRRGAHGNDHGHLAAQQFTGHGRQPIVLALRKPILDPQVAPLDIASLRQAESDCRSVGGSCCLQERAKKSDHRHRGLLPARRERSEEHTSELQSL